MIGLSARANAFSSVAGLRRLATRWGAAVALLGLAFSPSAASALSVTFDLEVELDTGQIGSYAQVTVEEDAGSLDFSIVLSDALGSEADLQEFYFNLLGSFTGIAIADDPTRAYELTANPSVRGGAGSSFDYGVNFGAGARTGNSILRTATFTLMADQPLALTDLVESSYAQGDTIEVSMAAHLQGTNSAAGSETVGGRIPTSVPEPTTGSLVGLGLVALAALRPARRSDR